MGTLMSIAGFILVFDAVVVLLLRRRALRREKVEAFQRVIDDAQKRFEEQRELAERQPAFVMFCSECNAPLLLSLLCSASDGDGLDEYESECPECGCGVLLQGGTVATLRAHYPNAEAVCPRI